VSHLFPPEGYELLGGGAGELAFALATCVDDLREHIRLTQNQNILAAELDLGPAVLREDDLVPLGDVHFDVLPVLVPPTRADRQDATALRLLPGRVRQDDPAHRQLLLIEHLDDQAVTKRLQIHEKPPKTSSGVSDLIGLGFDGLWHSRSRVPAQRISRHKAYSPGAEPVEAGAAFSPRPKGARPKLRPS